MFPQNPGWEGAKVFLGVSHGESLHEHFPLNCVTNSALGRALKCRHVHGAGFLFHLSSWPHPCYFCLKLAKPVCDCQKKITLFHPPRAPPTGLPYAAGSWKGSLPRTAEHTFSENPSSNFHGANLLGGFPNSFLPAQHIRKRADGWHLKCHNCILSSFLMITSY